MEAHGAKWGWPRTLQKRNIDRGSHGIRVFAARGKSVARELGIWLRVKGGCSCVGSNALRFRLGFSLDVHRPQGVMKKRSAIGL